jgi:predicted SAM-dependent methyltransferase
MIPRSAKAAFYALAAPFLWANGALYRALRAPRSGTVRVHLGPGQSKYLAGWINVDANAITARRDVWADLRNRLPFRDGSVDAFYSHHVVEHLPDQAFHFREVHRCLKPGGLYRVGGPHGDNAIARFVAGDAGWFGDFPDPRRSVGGRLANFIFCRNEHLTLLTFSYLEELFSDAGFSDVRACAPMTGTTDPSLIDADLLATEYESTPDCPHTLILEARKPPAGG